MADAPNLFKERILKTKNGFYPLSLGEGRGEVKQTILKNNEKINFQKTKQL